MMPSIKEEIKQGKPFKSLSQEAVVAFLRTSHLLRRHFERPLEEYGVTMQQYNVLRILRGSQNALPVMEVGERLVEPTPGITRLIQRLEKCGLVQTSSGESDRRQRMCEITQKGQKILKSMDKVMDRLDESSLSSLTDSQLNSLISIMEKIRVSLNQQQEV